MYYALISYWLSPTAVTPALGGATTRPPPATSKKPTQRYSPRKVQTHLTITAFILTIHNPIDDFNCPPGGTIETLISQNSAFCSRRITSTRKTEHCQATFSNIFCGFFQFANFGLSARGTQVTISPQGTLWIFDSLRLRLIQMRWTYV